MCSFCCVLVSSQSHGELKAAQAERAFHSPAQLFQQSHVQNMAVRSTVGQMEHKTWFFFIRWLSHVPCYIEQNYSYIILLYKKAELWYSCPFIHTIMNSRSLPTIVRQVQSVFLHSAVFCLWRSGRLITPATVFPSWWSHLIFFLFNHLSLRLFPQKSSVMSAL